MKTNYKTSSRVSNIMIVASALVLTLLLSFNLRAQTWTIYNKGNSGLVNDTLNYVTIDASGVKWIGSNKGLTKFDGTTWYTYNTTNSGLVSNSIKQIVVDPNGNKWVSSNFAMWGGGVANGITKFDGTTWTTYNKGNSGLNSDVIIGIAFDKNGNSWFGTDSGITKYNGTTWTNYKLPNTFSNKGVNAVTADAQGNIWMTSFFNGVYKFDGNTTWTQYTPSNTSNGLPTDQTISIVIDASGDAWIGCWGGTLVRYNGTSWNKWIIPGGCYAFKVSIDNVGNKWLGQWGGTGLQILDNTNTSWFSYTKTNSSLPYDFGNTTAIDLNGDKWVSTAGGGIVKISGNPTSVMEIANVEAFSSYPNPFSTSLNIDYALQNSAVVTLEVYNILGSKVASMADSEMQAAGMHHYRFENENAGVYIVKLVCGDKVLTQRIVSAQ